MLEIIMGLIMGAGDAKSSAMEAIQDAKTGDFETARVKLEDAGQALVNAHHSQTELLTLEAQGKQNQVSLLLVHAQDHLMNGISFVDIAKELVDMYERIYSA